MYVHYKNMFAQVCSRCGPQKKKLMFALQHIYVHDKVFRRRCASFYQTLFPSLPLLHKHTIRGHFATRECFSHYDSFKDMRRVMFGVLTVCSMNLRWDDSGGSLQRYGNTNSICRQSSTQHFCKLMQSQRAKEFCRQLDDQMCTSTSPRRRAL